MSDKDQFAVKITRKMGEGEGVWFHEDKTKRNVAGPPKQSGCLVFIVALSTLALATVAVAATL